MYSAVGKTRSLIWCENINTCCRAKRRIKKITKSLKLHVDYNPFMDFNWLFDYYNTTGKLSPGSASSFH